MTTEWTEMNVLALARGFQPACVLIGAAELGIFDALTDGPCSADDVAGRLNINARATAVLLDAMAAMELLAKDAGRYALSPGVAELLTRDSDRSVTSMVLHLGNCLRNWEQLSRVVRGGRRADFRSSMRGAHADQEAFIEAMDDVCRSVAPGLVEQLGPPAFRHLLDVGGGPATWTVAFLQAAPEARATVFDLADVIPIAQRHVAAAGLTGRVEFVAGDFNRGALPHGPDLAWVSAIAHMNSRHENRRLFGRVHTALADGGRILIRDVVMDDTLTSPAEGAMFAINMLVHTHGGRSYSFNELSEDLAAAGFSGPERLHEDAFMNSVIGARKA
ncbi:MAG: methyltransferase [Planctomycetota bacterium]